MIDAFLILSALSVLGSVVVVYILRRWALTRLMDIPNERSSHTIPTPRGGGLGIALVTTVLFIGALVTGSFKPGGDPFALSIFVIDTAIIAAIGWIDDRVHLSARLRLLLQLTLSALTVLLVGPITRILVPLLGRLILAPVIAYVLNVIWVVGFTNIYNFMDGIDGLAGSQALIAGIGWIGFFLMLGQVDLALYAALLAGSSLGFLFFNRPRALIFMGDAGSTFIGFSLAMLPLMAFTRLSDIRLIGLGMLFVAPFVLDGTFTIIRRALNHEDVLKPHRSHIYQRLVQLGYSHLHITTLYAIYMVLSVVCGWLYATTTDGVLLGLSVLIPLLVFVALVVWTTRKETRAVRATA